MENQMNIPQLRFPEFEGEWEKKKLGDVIEKLESGVSVNSTDEPIGNGSELGILKTSAVYLGRFMPNENKKIIEVEIERARLNPVKNSILISRMNTPQLVGNSGLVEKDYPNLFIPDRLWLAKTNSHTNSKMLSIVLSSEKTMSMISNISTGTSGSMKNISQPNFLNLEISFPTLPEQDKIAQFIRSIDQKIQALKKKKKLLENYKKGVMQRIFNYELDNYELRIRFKDENGEEFPEWEVKKLGEVCEIKKGEQLNKEELTETGSYPCLNGGINFSGYTDKFNSEENTITISEGGNSCGYINFMTSKFWLGGHCYKILFTEELNKNYFYQLLKFNEQKIMNLRVGSGLPNIQQKDIRNFEFVISNSLPEQTTIANFLSAIDKKIKNTQTQITQTEIWKKGLLQKMFV